MYPFFSYGTHELLCLVPLTCQLVTAIWLVLTLFQERKDRAWKSRLPFALLLALLLAVQTGYRLEQYRMQRTFLTATVVQVDSKTAEMVVEVPAWGEIVLDCPMLVQGIVAPGRTYSITYKHRADTPQQGKLCMIALDSAAE